MECRLAHEFGNEMGLIFGNFSEIIIKHVNVYNCLFLIIIYSFFLGPLSIN
jgi:hypothetical protein